MHEHALEPRHFGLRDTDVQALAERLGVATSEALPETLAHVALCKLKRGEECSRDDLVEIWDSIPEALKNKDNSLPGARIMVFGANPRKPDSVTQASLKHPNTTKLLAKYILLRCPEITCTTVSFRLNADKGPHRDRHNGPEPSFLQVLIPQNVGGDLWLADPKGTSTMSLNGTSVVGRIVPCHDSPWFSVARPVFMPHNPGQQPAD